MVRAIITGVAWFTDENERDSFIEEARSLLDEQTDTNIQALERKTTDGSEYGLYVPQELYPPRMNYLIDGIGDEPGVRVADEWQFVIVETLEVFSGTVTTTDREAKYDLDEWIEANAPALAADKPDRDAYGNQSKHTEAMMEWWSDCQTEFINHVRDDLSIQPRVEA